ncbi:helix-turn-helix transcriptional regulator [Halomonas alkaliantarctica]|uniref:helix-turn-helix transcriptional regulator n=1 Tax=Halomonas alkaliantarctica TaxID=232346 RepID=UPI0004AA62BD|nr:hypothetical protein [Halomonas alkaliantarctica]
MTYEFILKFAIPSDLDGEVLETSLYESGCDDALIGIGLKGRLALEFAREAASAQQAITSAMADVKRAIPDARLIEVGPDLVGVTDIAELLVFTRQNMRKLVQSHLATFPLPLHEGRASLWHLSEVLDWFQAHQRRQVDSALCEVARVCMQANVARESRRVPTEQIRHFNDVLAS